MKKRLLFVIVITLFIFSSNHTVLSNGDVGTGNLRNFYTKYEYVNLKNVKDKNSPESHRLEYSYKNDTLYAEFDNEYITSDLKGKNVDVFGISYKDGSNSRTIYGGVTKAENNKLDSPRIIPINLIINGKHQTVTTKSVSTDKKMVTAQEIDVKLRKYLQDEFNIYGHNDTGKGKEYGTSSKFYSGFDKGSVVFHMNDGSNFSYDLFYTGYGLPESFLKIYKDNKTVDSTQFHLDVEISKKWFQLL